MGFTNKQKDFMAAAKEWAATHGKDLSKMDKHDLQGIANSVGMKFPHWITRVPIYKVGRGLWSVPVNGAPAIKAVADSSVGVDKAPDPITVTTKPTAPAVVAPVVEMAKGANGIGQTHVPEKDPLFVPFGSFTDMVSILKSEMFYPIFVTGLSGNGKTTMI